LRKEAKNNLTSRKYVIATLKKGGQKFEILVDPWKAHAYREGQPISIDNIVIVEEVFSDAKKGEKHSRETLEKIFGTSDFKKVAEIILKEGRVPLTQEQRKELAERLRRQIINMISKLCIDARTKHPIPPKRVELALEEAKVRIDINRSADEQIMDIIKKLSMVIPIKYGVARIAIKVPPIYYARVYPILKEYGELKQTEWGRDGSFYALLELPLGLREELIGKLASLSKGEIQVKLLD